MSEVQILKKLTAPTIKVSSDDPHRIVNPARKPPATATAAERKAGGVPIQPPTPNVQIHRAAQVMHVTSASSSQKSEIKGTPPMPPALAKKQAEREAAQKAQAAARGSGVSDHLPDYDDEEPTPRAKHAPEGPARGNPQRKI